MGSENFEIMVAKFESDRSTDMDEYFNARPIGLRTKENERLFCGGYRKAFERFKKSQDNRIVENNQKEIDGVTSEIRKRAIEKRNAIHNCEMSMAEGAECQCGEHVAI